MTLRITHFERPLVQVGHSLTAKGRIFSRGRDPFQDAWVGEAVRDYATDGDLARLPHQRKLAALRPVRVEADPLVHYPNVFALYMVTPGEGANFFACSVLDMKTVEEEFVETWRGCFIESATIHVAPSIVPDAPKGVLAMDLAVSFIGWAFRVLGEHLALTDVEVDVASDAETKGG